jgi:uncharacterized membrane protein
MKAAFARITTIDLLRGLVMVIMALDHVRDLLHHDAFFFNPLDETKTTPVLYLTRWVTHFCAPTFVMLSGTSAYLVGLRKTRQQLSSFLLSRGCWLIFADLVIMSFAWSFTPRLIAFGVLAVMGSGMILLALLVRLPDPVVPGIGLAMIFLHNTLDGVRFAPGSLAQNLWGLLHVPGIAPVGGFTVLVGYPLIPWVGLMMTGYGLGMLYRPEYDAGKRKRLLQVLGLSAIFLFFLLRSANIYGDPVLWKPGADAVQTFMIFFNVLKYPPSLLFLLVTLGPVLLMLSWLETARISENNPLVVLGRVPFFYFVVHFYMIHLVAIAVAVGQGHPPGAMLSHNFILDMANIRDSYGVSLTWVYVIWALLVLGLYPLCKWYAGYKASHREQRWLSYF